MCLKCDLLIMLISIFSIEIILNIIFNNGKGFKFIMDVCTNLKWIDEH